jgi:ABC-type branched-subunit amino acid transport system ATPase component
MTQRFGGLLALDEVSVSVREREILSLIGPNGAGKTTLLNAIAGTLEPAAGEVLFRGKSLRGRAAHERVELGLARTFQQALVFGDMTVLENTLTGCHRRGRCGLVAGALNVRRARREEEGLYLDALRYLNLVGLGSRAHDLASTLPFGQQRLLAIARALASDPTVLLMDEPAAGLNRLEKNDLIDLVRRIRDMGITIVLVEHDMQVVMQLAEWVVVLDHGRRLAQGTPGDIRRNPDVVAAYLGAD